MTARTETPVIEMVDVAVGAANPLHAAEVTGVNWTVEIGDYWVIGGLPGSGKSDLLSTAAGLLKPLRGVHRLFGKEMGTLPEEDAVRVRSRIGLVFSNEGRLFNHLTVAENLALPICYHRNCEAVDAQDRVRTVLEATGLSSVAHNTPGAINRSMRQRVALARALALSPEVLLLDDPLRGLDPLQIKWWLEFLARLCSGHDLMERCKTTLAVTTDNIRPWTTQGKKFALLSEGRWLEVGGPDELNDHADPLLRELMSSGF